MKRTSDNPLFIDHCNDHGDACDLDALLHPAQAFEHPSDVVNATRASPPVRSGVSSAWPTTSR
jgi:hypothetical protein